MSVLEPLALVAIIVMAAAVYLMRAGGFWLMGRIPLTPRVRRMLEALPGSIIASIILPLVDRMGVVALCAVAAGAVMMIVRRNELLAVAVGIATAVAVRVATS